MTTAAASTLIASLSDHERRARHQAELGAIRDDARRRTRELQEQIARIEDETAPKLAEQQSAFDKETIKLCERHAKTQRDRLGPLALACHGSGYTTETVGALATELEELEAAQVRELGGEANEGRIFSAFAEGFLARHPQSAGGLWSFIAGASVFNDHYWNAIISARRALRSLSPMVRRDGLIELEKMIAAIATRSDLPPAGALDDLEDYFGAANPWHLERRRQATAAKRKAASDEEFRRLQEMKAKIQADAVGEDDDPGLVARAFKALSDFVAMPLKQRLIGGESGSDERAVAKPVEDVIRDRTAAWRSRFAAHAEDASKSRFERVGYLGSPDDEDSNKTGHFTLPAHEDLSGAADIFHQQGA
jgi:hypothetical protein